MGFRKLIRKPFPLNSNNTKPLIWSKLYNQVNILFKKCFVVTVLLYLP
jgi:hypothetical protein